VDVNVPLAQLTNYLAIASLNYTLVFWLYYEMVTTIQCLHLVSPKNHKSAKVRVLKIDRY